MSTALTLLITFFGLFIASLAVSVGSPRRKSVAIPSIVLGSITLATIVVLSLELVTTAKPLRVNLLGLTLRADLVSFIVILNVFFLGIASLLASYRYCEIVEEPGYGPYYALMIVFLTSMALIPLAWNWLWFLFLFEVMTMASYFLIGYEYRNVEASRIAWNYFVTMHVLCTLPLVIAIGLTYSSTGTLEFIKTSITPLALMLFLIGFATKSGLFPIHFWLPDAHPIAPTPVSALLSGAMVEMGVYGLYRVIELYGPEPPWFSTLLVALAFISTLAAVMSYYRQKDIKRLFAWSTIDNIGWMYLALSMGCYGSVVATYILNHGLAKAASFLSSGLALYVFGTRNLEELRGSFGVDRLTVGLTITSILALEGVPPFNFFWSKFNVVRLVLSTNPALGFSYALLWAIAFVIFLHVIHGLIEVKGGEKKNCNVRAVHKPPLSMVASIAFLLAILLISNILCSYITSLVSRW